MVWEAVYADGWANLRFACKKPEVLWRLAKLENLRGIDWLKLVLCSSGRRLTCQASVDNPICKYGTPFFKPIPLVCIEIKAPEAGLSALCGQKRKPVGHWWVACSCPYLCATF